MPVFIFTKSARSVVTQINNLTFIMFVTIFPAVIGNWYAGSMP